MANKAGNGRRGFDAAGWLFWTVVFLVLLGPAIYGGLRIKDKDASWVAPVAIGAVAASLGAALVSWAVNAVLQHRSRKQRIAHRKKARKRQ